jgi:hypothetical protein
MSSFAWILLLVILLTFLGSAALLLVTLRYYWGERGAAPPTREQRQKQRMDELAARTKQLEYSEKHPREPRNPSFFDNRKRRPRTGENR